MIVVNLKEERLTHGCYIRANHRFKGMKLHIIPTEKYKTNTIVFKMKAPLDKEDVTKRALLPNVLQRNSKKYSTTALLRSYLDELYGATFYIDLAKKGDYHIISFTIEIAIKNFSPMRTAFTKGI